MSTHQNLKFILLETSHPGNIGAAARAIKTMGFSSLRLVAPKRFPDPEADARASGAEDVLRSAQVFTSLEDAIKDCHIAVGLSARDRTLGWNQQSPRQGAGNLAAIASCDNVALVFGRESSGLSNAELQCCQYQWHIDANPDYSSLNLAAAVQIVAYELRLAFAQNSASTAQESDPRASIAQRDAMIAHLLEGSEAIGFLKPGSPKLLEQRLRRLFNRDDLSESEVKFLRGLARRMIHAGGSK